MSGTLEAIWIKRAHRGPMDRVQSATLVAGRGITGNADQGRFRQVTIIEQEVWISLMEETGGDLDPSIRRANLMVSGLALAESRGKVLQIGRCRIRIRGETRPCEQMEASRAGLQTAMQAAWRGGAFGEVLDDGELRVGDPARWVPEDV